jgi:carboxyl-terminal processing protease
MRILAALLLAGSLASQTITLRTRPNLNAESFEYVWKTVRDKHWDPELGGVDWQQVHDSLLPRIERAVTVAETRKIMTEMLANLHQSHFQIIPATTYSELAPGQATGGEGDLGIDVRVIDRQAVVVSVDAGSPAEKAQVSTGWIVRKVDSFELAPVIASFLDRTPDTTLRDLTLRRALLLRMQGPIGEAAHVTFVDGRNEAVYKNIVRAEPRGTSASIGYLGPAHVKFDAREIALGDDRVQYIAFNLFLDPANLMQQFNAAVQAGLSCDGYIIDLRGNPGGLGAMATGMASWFVDEKDAMLGTLILRETSLKFVINPRPETYGGPLAILVDGSTASTAEILAGGLQDLKRARIFGERTAAAALPSVVERLPNGDAFQYAIANYVSEGGKTLEGLGVLPDVEVYPTREALLAHKDLALEAALKWIESQRTQHD